MCVLLFFNGMSNHQYFFLTMQRYCFARHVIGGVLSHYSIMAVLKDSKNILIIHFGVLLKGSTLDSMGHDLWKNIT